MNNDSFVDVAVNPMKLYPTYDEFKKHLLIYVYNQFRKIDTDVRKEVGDMHIYCHVEVYAKPNREELHTCCVDERFLTYYNIDMETLFADAFENSPNQLPPDIRSLRQCMIELMDNKYNQREIPFDQQLEELNPLEDGMFVLSNKYDYLGAGTLFYPGLLNRIANKLGGNLFIAPTSIHEVTIASPSRPVDPAAFLDMAIKCNVAGLPRYEWLSESLLYYDKDTDTLNLAK